MPLRALAAAGLLFVLAGAAHLSNPPVPETPRPLPGDSLRAPPVLANVSRAPRTVEVTLTVATTTLEMVPGTRTEVFAYNGMVPGPTLEVQEGDRLIIHVRNELPEETTVHWHGLHLPWQADGSPFLPIAPGTEADFDFIVPPGSAGTYWYHPHPHHRTAYQVARGLYGAIVVRAVEDPLPAMTEKLIVLSDNRFNEDGSVQIPDQSSMEARIDFENGREGDVIFVNGQIAPTIGIRSGEVQRWRIVNASAARVYRLGLEGHEILHVGSDGGLFGEAIATDAVVVSASERVEVLVRGTGAPGSTARFQALPYDRYIPQTRPRDWEAPRDILTLEYAPGSPVEPVEIPAVIRPIEPLDPSSVSATRVFALTQGFINGKTMDMTRVDEVTTLGSTEIWQVENLVGMDHPFHLHGFSFQVIDRNGVPEPFPKWEDTVNVPKHEFVRFIVRFEDYPGRWMYHCHILDHENFGMMGILEVRRPEE
ncbi:MAG TPA: multicopper oxidase family protein [Longimicrobiales bacterium]|nr:multicopper oxidase family protein [Longimicrobiales bacterium]